MATGTIINVISSGSNSNGSYIKFADGTMIEYGSFSASLTANNYTEYELTFPVEFQSYPSLTLCPELWADPRAYSWIIKSKGTARPVFRLGNTGSAQTVDWRWIAIGRWK